MLFNRLFGILVLIFVSLAHFCPAEELELKSYFISEMTVGIDQIVISQEGIFVSLEGIIYPILDLSMIKPGVYSIRAIWECPEHGAYCPACGGCNPRNNCKYRCKCGRG